MELGEGGGRELVTFEGAFRVLVCLRGAFVTGRSDCMGVSEHRDRRADDRERGGLNTDELRGGICCHAGGSQESDGGYSHQKLGREKVEE